MDGQRASGSVFTRRICMFADLWRRLPSWPSLPGRPNARRPAHSRLAVEVLEERRLLSAGMSEQQQLQFGQAAYTAGETSSVRPTKVGVFPNDVPITVTRGGGVAGTL